MDKETRPTRRAIKKESPELSIALQNRAFEIQLFWQRSNYFLVLITALGVGAFSIEDEFFAFCASLFATIASWFWYQTNLGSKFWQESWECEVNLLSKEENIRSFMKTTTQIESQVRESLNISPTTLNKGYIRRFVDSQIVKKPSVTYNMIMLSVCSMLIWASITIVYGARVADRTTTIETVDRWLKLDITETDAHQKPAASGCAPAPPAPAAAPPR